MHIRIPKWVQIVGLPLLVLLLWFGATEVSRVIFIFLGATVIALMLNPLVRHLERLKIPRVLGVFIVYLLLIAIIAAIFVVIIPPAVDQLQEIIDQMPFYATEVGDQMTSWKRSLEHLNLPFDISAQGDKIVSRLEDYVADLGSKVVSLSFDFLSALAQLLLVVVISIYMLVDAKRIGRSFRSLFPAGGDKDADELILSTQKAVNHWVLAQALLGILIGLSSGIGIWLLDVTGIWPGGSDYAIFFGVWAGITEFIPYIGPILGAAPPVFVAMFSSPWSALAVVILFIVIQQLEGHVLVPNIMGSIVGVHPLIVIFAVLAGAQIYGIGGMILALPVVALIRQLFIFFKTRVILEKAPASGAVDIAANADSAGGEE